MIAVIGLDIAKNVFQVHGIDEMGQPALKRKLRRAEVLRLTASQMASASAASFFCRLTYGLT
jgi:transposase